MPRIKRDTARLGYTVAQSLLDYAREHVDLKCAAPDRQMYAIRYLSAYFEGVFLKNVDVPACRAYAEARGRGVITGGTRTSAKGSSGTVRRELTVLRAAGNHAVKWRRISAGEAPSIELPESPPSRDAVWLTKDEVRALMAAASGPLADFIMLAYFTGSRRGAIESLRVEQIDIANRHISLRKSGERVTAKRRPVVPVHPQTASVVERLVRDARDGWLFGPRADFYHPFHDLCLSAGIDAVRAHPHVLRHSRITHLLMDGVNPYDVGRLVGDSLQTIDRTYGHMDPDHLASTTAGGL